MSVDRDTIRVWTRKELEENAAKGEETKSHLKVNISSTLILLLMNYASTTGHRVEVVSAHGDPTNVSIQLYRRDTDTSNG